MNSGVETHRYCLGNLKPQVKALCFPTNILLNSFYQNIKLEVRVNFKESIVQAILTQLNPKELNLILIEILQKLGIQYFLKFAFFAIWGRKISGAPHRHKFSC